MTYTPASRFSRHMSSATFRFKDLLAHKPELLTQLQADGTDTVTIPVYHCKRKYCDEQSTDQGLAQLFPKNEFLIEILDESVLGVPWYYAKYC